MLLFLTVAALILTAKGVKIDDNGNAEWVDYKYLHNFLEMWWNLVILLVGVVMVLFGIGKTLLKKNFSGGIWFAGIGTVLVVLTLFFTLGFNGTAYYPSLVDVNSSLSIRNSSSSLFTLEVMSWVSILVPFVLAYIFYAWHSIDHVKITREEMQEADPEEKY